MSLQSGARLGPYEILAPLGAGGMGEVYRARDTRLGREVAIKVLPSALAADPERVRRFEREARSVSALNHPNIVTIYEVGSSDSVAYIAMELVDGESLREVLLDGALPVRRAPADRRPGGRGACEGARLGHRASGPEARERDGDGGRARQDPGLRPGQADAAGLGRRRPAAGADDLGSDPGGSHRGHRRLHVSRAGDGSAGRLSVGSVLVRLHSLRDGDRPAGVPARLGAADASGHHPGRARADRER